MTLEGLNPTRTDSEGIFVLSMRPSTQVGERIKLEIDKPGYCILSPFNGEVVVPGDKRPIEMRLLRSGSKQGTTQDCIAKFIEGVANKPKSPTRLEQKPEPLDLPHGYRFGQVGKALASQISRLGRSWTDGSRRSNPSPATTRTCWDWLALPIRNLPKRANCSPKLLRKRKSSSSEQESKWS